MSDEHPEDQAEVLPTQEPLKDYSGEIKPGPGANKPDTDQIVEEWFDSHIRGSVVGQNTQIWNHIVAAKERLKEKLRSQ